MKIIMPKFSEIIGTGKKELVTDAHVTCSG
jgi:hypothetical protein